MRILIDIGHPGHVHLFKNFAKEMHKKGHTTLFTCRQKEFEKELLQAIKFNFKSFGKHYNTKVGKIWGLVKFNLIMLLTALRFKPDLFLSHGSIYAAQIAWLIGKPHISMEDSGNMEQIKLYRPFTKAILVPDVLPQNFGTKQINYHANHELHYLHPDYFEPSPSIYDYLEINKDTPFCILRFVSWKATHDYGHAGFSAEEKKKLIDYLSSKMKVFITSEIALPKEYQTYQIKIPPEKIHHALYFADLVISEGATIASEAGLVGTPTIYVNSIVRYYNEDQERYGLVFNFRNGSGVLEKAKEIIENNHKKTIQKNKSEYMKDKINPTNFLIWFIENYPESAKIMKENPEYQYQFK
jgi:hypothetical protein